MLNRFIKAAQKLPGFGDFMAFLEKKITLCHYSINNLQTDDAHKFMAKHQYWKGHIEAYKQTKTILKKEVTKDETEE